MFKLEWYQGRSVPQEPLVKMVRLPEGLPSLPEQPLIHLPNLEEILTTLVENLVRTKHDELKFSIILR